MKKVKIYAVVDKGGDNEKRGYIVVQKPDNVEEAVELDGENTVLSRYWSQTKVLQQRKVRDRLEGKEASGRTYTEEEVTDEEVGAVAEAAE